MSEDYVTDVSNPRETGRLIRKYGLALKKSLGQNFLIDPNILRHIVAAAELDQSKGALEIGPGAGALTQQLAKKAGRVVAVEIDRRLQPVLAETLAPYPNATVVFSDVLKLDLRELWNDHFRDCSRVSVVANLPYYATTPIVMKLLMAGLKFEYIVVMVQREVAERMLAKPGGKDYGSLSVAVQYYCVPERIAIVPPTVFVPQPNVDSAVIRLKLRDEPPARVRDESFFFELVRACFAQRRKTIANNLTRAFFAKAGKSVAESLLNRCGIEPGRRGETLTIEQFAALSDAVFGYLHDTR